MTKMKLWTLAAAVSLGALATPAAAQGPVVCGAYEAITSSLETKHGEQQVFAGILADKSGMIWIYLSPESRTWTLLIRNGRGTCVIGHGKHGQAWRPIPGEPA